MSDLPTPDAWIDQHFDEQVQFMALVRNTDTPLRQQRPRTPNARPS